MLPIKTRSIFKSRWIALLWAGGIVWSAAEFVGVQPHHAAPAADNGAATTNDASADGNQAAADVAQVAQVKAALKGFDSIS